MKRKTREETAEAQIDAVVSAVEELCDRAKTFARAESSYHKRELVQQALVCARRVRRIAGVR